MKITVFGIGYVGLVQAAVLADAGHHVYCVDIDERKVENLNNNIIPIYEPGLTPLIEHNRNEGRLHFTTDASEAISHGEFQFIAVGTPPDEDGSADLQYVLAVAETIATHMSEPKIIINKSTVPVGTADIVKAHVSKILAKRNETLSFHVVSNPEFLKEGAAISDCAKPDRIVIGTDSDEVADKLKELYAPFNRNHNRIILMDLRSAELTKYAANCMLATKISFMNEMANLAEQLDADIEAVRQGIGSDTRIGYHFIYPGCGYGGSCFPKDVRALIRTGESIGYNSHILKSVEAVNNRQKGLLYDKIEQHFALHHSQQASQASVDELPLSGKTFALWGLSFKPNTDDMRDAPSRVLMEALWDAGAHIQAFDPEAMNECQRIYGQRNDLTLMGTKEATLRNADALIIVTEWKQFWTPDFDLIKSELSTPTLFDGRNLYNPAQMKERGFNYYSIGRASYTHDSTEENTFIPAHSITASEARHNA
ncbi:MAG: UDP-glucose/GDP-mannose dehydrogenase family protein [Chromatiales bacterium]|nr:UDP-glucose/GDP-mannose dehydrogenase family protein [Chromatiales bacterium]